MTFKIVSVTLGTPLIYALTILELLVLVVQAYVFTLLTSIFCKETSELH